MKALKLREVVQICPGTHSWYMSNELRFKSRCAPPGLRQPFILVLFINCVYGSICVCAHMYSVSIHVSWSACTCGGQRTTFESQFSPSPVGSGAQTQVAKLGHLTALSFQAQTLMLFHSLSLSGFHCLA